MNHNVSTLPDLGEGLTEAHLVRWRVQPGDTVTTDTPVAEVETAKATVELPCPFSGVIAELQGATIRVGAPLISVDIDHSSPADDVDHQRAGSGGLLIGYGASQQPPRSRRRRSTQRRTTAAPATIGWHDPRVASPIVRTLAKSKGVDLAALHGTGPNGLITRADVERATDHATSRDHAPTRRTAVPVSSLSPHDSSSRGSPATPPSMHEAKVTEDDIVAWCRQNMAAHKYPRLVEFRETIPMTATGKIRKRELTPAPSD
jgi:2-oxoisovalerate dehydrogenase E2 component (dihydrolipoyl transacylase)